MEYRNKVYQSYVTKHVQCSYCQTYTKESYDFMAMKLKKQFQPFLPKDKTAQILDLACGSGYFLYFLQREGYNNASGIDLSAEQVALAKQVGVKNVQVDDLFSFLPKCSHEFNMIIASHVIEHFTKDEIIKFLDAIHAALQPGGIALISTINAFSLFGAGCVFADFTHEVGFTPISLAHVLRICGFTDVAVYGEKPIAHDLRSKIRQILWKVVSKMLLAFLSIERGYGREVLGKGQAFILEPRIFAVARKP